MMKFLFTLVIYCCFGLHSPTNTTATETTIYYFIRHAEKVKNTNTKDPELLPKGLERAEQWANTFKQVPLDAVYSTDYKRTVSTALPTANSKGLPITKYHPTKIDYDTFLNDTKGKNVLIVGHSNTIPGFVNQIIGKEKYDDISHDNNANLYIVTIANGNITDMVLYID